MVQEMMITGLLSSITSINGNSGDNSRQNLIRDVEKDLVKNVKLVTNVQQLQFFGTYRGIVPVNYSIYFSLRN